MENGTPYSTWYQEPPRPEPFPIGNRELVLAVLAIPCGAMLANFTLFGGFSLGFSVAAVLCIGLSAGYLICSGCKLGWYPATLLALAVVLVAAFSRTDDVVSKVVLLPLLAVSVELGLCLLAGQNRWGTAGVTSLLDAPRALFTMGFGQAEPALHGLKDTLKNGGPAVRKGGSVLLGLAIAVPVLAVVVGLLVSADAAFDGLLSLLPEPDLPQAIVTVGFGVMAAAVFFIRGTALRHRVKEEGEAQAAVRSVSHLTVDTVLVLVCLVYVVYLFSQLAYFVGGFSGILPEDFTLAEYARRGFFEMAWLCAIDLGIMALAVGLVQKQEDKAPLSTRLLCLTVGLVTLFFVGTACAKMLLYIDAYGLTRLRVLTSVVMAFLAVTTVIVSLWLFLPKIPYMQWVLILALAMGSGVLWTDVDTVVASYNVSAYQSGALADIDMTHLNSLGAGAVPQIAKLVHDPDPVIAKLARMELEERARYAGQEDLRGWNFVIWYAAQALEQWKQ